MTTASFDRLIHIADRLGRVQVGSPAADQAIHQALDRCGTVLTYTTAEDVAQSLLPAGFELLPATFGAGGGLCGLPAQRDGWRVAAPAPWAVGHHVAAGDMRACLRAYAALDQDRDSAGRR